VPKPTIRQLQMFVEVIRCRSFRKAAECLNTSQPALSRGMKELEALLGTLLINRTTRSVSPTEAGKEFFSRAIQLLRELDELIDATNAVAAGKRGRLKLTYMDFAIIGRLPYIIRQFKERHPDILLDVQYSVSQEQFPMIDQGLVDIGFVSGEPSRNGFSSRVVAKESLLAVVPENHNLAKRESISLGELSEECFVTGDHRWIMYTDKLSSICNQHGFEPRVVQTGFTRDEILSFVLAGIGITVYPECITNVPRPGLHYVPISDVGRRIVTSAIWKNSNANPALLLFLEQLSKADHGWSET
jgi:DNA-binding transcriptional LysR family regulator